MSPQFVGATGIHSRDLSNVIPPSPTIGGRFYQVVVSCADPVAGNVELEFAFRYGL